MFAQVKKPLFLFCLMLAMFIGPAIVPISPSIAPGSIAAAVVPNNNPWTELAWDMLDFLDEAIAFYESLLANCIAAGGDCSDLEGALDELNCVKNEIVDALCGI